jgi:hypothetical protein
MYRRVIRTGDRLAAALAAERLLEEQLDQKGDPELLARWKRTRDAISQLQQDYFRTIYGLNGSDSGQIPPSH